MAVPNITLSNGAKMPALGLGTWQATSPAELENALDAALEAGYRHYDTAFVYQNEALIGKVLQKWFKSGKVKREDLFITTKLPVIGISPEGVEKYIDISLKNLQLDYVDLYLIHFPVGIKGDDKKIFATNEQGDIILEPTDHLAVWKKLEEQVDAGKTKAIGVSNFTAKQIKKILDAARIKPACHQFESHVSLQQNDLVDFCLKNGICVVAYSPLANPSYKSFAKSMGVEVTKELPNILEEPVVVKVANKHKKTAAQVLLRFLVERGLVPIPKSVSQKRLVENIFIFDFQLDAEDIKALKSLDKGEIARVCDWGVFKGLEKHPEYPFGLP